MTTTSILVQRVVDMHLRTARQQLEQVGALQPVLYIRIAGDHTFAIPLTLPDSFEQKSRYFWGLGRYLLLRGLQPTEAVLISESWVVPVQQTPSAMDFPPSQHPSRQEAIVAIGRSADGNRYTQVVQTFTRNKHDRPVWQAIPMADYDQPQTSGKGSAGLLDCLFEAMSVNRH